MARHAPSSSNLANRQNENRGRGSDLDGHAGFYEEPLRSKVIAAGKAEGKVGALLNAGRAKDAYDLIKSFRAANSGMLGRTRHDMVPLALLVDKYDEAYEELALMPKLNSISWLHLSLAASARGEVVPGQAEYCDQQIALYFSEEEKDFPYEVGRYRTDPRSVMVRSLIAIGVSNGTGSLLFLERAMVLDPTNEVAVSETMRLHEHRLNYTQARRIGSQMVERLPAGPVRDRFLSRLAYIEGLKDGGTQS